MRRSCSIIIAVLLAALVVVSASLGYAYHRKSAEVKRAKDGLISISNMDVLCLIDMDVFQPMLKYNVDSELFKARLNRYSYCAQDLADASWSLYQLTGEKRYSYLNSAAQDLSEYFTTAMNTPDPRENVEKNLGTLMKISNTFFNITRERGVQKMTQSQAEKLFNLTQALSG